METTVGDQPEEHAGTTFNQKAFVECKGVVLDEATVEFVRTNPHLTVKLVKLRGVVSSLDTEQQKLVRRTEYELWQYLQELEHSDPGLANEVTGSLAWWERYGYPPLASDFTYDDIWTVKNASPESAFAKAIFDIMPGKENRPPINSMKSVGQPIDVSPKYL